MFLKKEIKIGTLFIVSIILLYFGSFYLKQASFFSDNNEYFFLCENTQGLEEGSKVICKGIASGRVKQVSFVDKKATKIKITVQIKKSLVLTDKSLCRINSGFLSGVTKSFIDLEISDGNQIKNGDELNVIPDKELKEIIAPTIQNVGDLLSATNKFLFEIAKNTDNVAKIFLNLEKVTAHINEIIERNEKNFLGISDTIYKIVNSLSHPDKGISSFLHQLNLLMQKINSEYTVDLIKNVSEASAKIDILLKKLVDSEGSLSKILSSSELHDNLVGLTKSADILLKNVKMQPDRYVTFSLLKFGENKNKTS